MAAYGKNSAFGTNVSSFHHWAKKVQLYPFLVVLAIVVFFAVQYPIQTTFPMGNDTTRYILRSQGVIERFKAEGIVGGVELLQKNSQYPGAIAFLAVVRFLVPLEWPNTFTWAMVFVEVGVGVAVYWFLSRLYSKGAGLAGLFIWGTTISVNHYFVNGVLAFQLSLIPMLLTFERIHSHKWIQATLFLVLTYAFHALTGMFLLLVVCLMAFPIFANRSRLTISELRPFQNFLFVSLLLAGIAAFFWLDQLLTDYSVDKHRVLLSRLFFSGFGPAILISPVGLSLIVGRFQKHFIATVLFICITFAAILLTFNHLIGVGWFVRRFEGYLILVIVLLSSIAIDWLWNRFSAGISRLILVLFIVLVGVTSFYADQRTYAHFELPNYARVHPNELAAIKWIREHSSVDGQVASPKHLHAEWIPIVADRELIELEESHPLLVGSNERVERWIAENSNVELLVLFTRGVSLMEMVNASNFEDRVVYENPGVFIIDLSL